MGASPQALPTLLHHRATTRVPTREGPDRATLYQGPRSEHQRHPAVASVSAAPAQPAVAHENPQDSGRSLRQERGRKRAAAEPEGARRGAAPADRAARSGAAVDHGAARRSLADGATPRHAPGPTAPPAGGRATVSARAAPGARRAVRDGRRRCAAARRHAHRRGSAAETMSAVRHSLDHSPGRSGAVARLRAADAWPPAAPAERDSPRHGAGRRRHASRAAGSSAERRLSRCGPAARTARSALDLSVRADGHDSRCDAGPAALAPGRRRAAASRADPLRHFLAVPTPSRLAPTPKPKFLLPGSARRPHAAAAAPAASAWRFRTISNPAPPRDAKSRTNLAEVILNCGERVSRKRRKRT